MSDSLTSNVMSRLAGCLSTCLLCLSLMLPARVAADFGYGHLHAAVAGHLFSNPVFSGGLAPPYGFNHFGGPPIFQPPSPFFGHIFGGPHVHGGHLPIYNGHPYIPDPFGTGDPYHLGPGYYQPGVFNDFHDNGFRDTFDDPIYLFD